MTLTRPYPGKNAFRRAANHIGALTLEGIESGELDLRVIYRLKENGWKEVTIYDGDRVQMYLISPDTKW